MLTTLTPEGLWASLIEERAIVLEELHIKLSSGKHTKDYADFVPAKIKKDTRLALVSHLGVLTKVVRNRTPDFTIDAILTIGVGQWYAFQLGDFWDVPVAVATKNHINQLVLTRGQGQVLAHRNVLIFDDVFHTCATTKAMVQLLRRINAKPIGALGILDRNPKRRTVIGRTRVKAYTLFHHPMKACPPSECLSCKAGIPLSTEHGAGAEQVFMHGQPERIPSNTET